LGRGGAAVTVAAALSNLLGYLVPLLGARTLQPDSLGAVAAIMAILAISGVPGMGLQIAVAMAQSRHGSVPRLARLTLFTAAVAALALIALTPVLASALRLPWPAIPLTAAIAGLVIAGNGRLGVLQGNMRFPRLAAGMALQAIARCGGIIAGLILRLDLLAVLGLGVAGAVLATIAIYLLAPAPTVTDGPAPWRDTWAASSATLVFFILSYVDLIAARKLLPGSASGDYAVLSVLTKGAIWAPGVISIMAVPYFARDVKRSRWIAAAAVLVVGAALTGLTVVFGHFALQLAGGPAYTRLASLAPAFALAGSLWALVYVLTNAQVAGGAKTPAAPLWVVAAVYVAVLLNLPHPTISRIVTCAIGAGLVCVLALLVAIRLSRAAPAQVRR
jgi:O-antigen/teichoic acid export membrane protein